MLILVLKKIGCNSKSSFQKDNFKYGYGSMEQKKKVIICACNICNHNIKTCLYRHGWSIALYGFKHDLGL